MTAALVFLLLISLITVFYFYSTSKKMQRRADEAARHYNVRIEQMKKEYAQRLKDDQERIYMKALEKVKARYEKQWGQQWRKSAAIKKEEKVESNSLSDQVETQQKPEPVLQDTAEEFAVFDQTKNHFISNVLQHAQLVRAEIPPRQWQLLERDIDRAYREQKGVAATVELIRQKYRGTAESTQNMMLW